MDGSPLLPSSSSHPPNPKKYDSSSLPPLPPPFPRLSSKSSNQSRRASTAPHRLRRPSVAIQALDPTKQNTAYAVSASFITDALHGRENTLYNTTTMAVSCKFLYHSRFYRDSVTAICILHVMLGLVEHRHYGWFEGERAKRASLEEDEK